MADKQLWEVTPVANDIKNDDGVIIGGQTAGTRYAPLTLIANFVHNLWAAFINAITPLKTSFASGDKFPVVNGNTATAMEASKLLELTAQNALANNVAPEFVPNITKTIAGREYTYKGLVYKAKEVYQGEWDESKFIKNDISSVLSEQNSSIQEIRVDVDSVSDKKYVNIPVNIDEGKLISGGGVITNYEDSRFVVTDYIDVSDYDRIKVDCSAVFGNAACVFYNSDYSVNSVAIKNPTGTGYTWIAYSQVVEVPADAKYMVLAGTNYSGGAWPKADYDDGVTLKIEKDFNDLKEIVEDITEEKYIAGSVSLINKKLIGSNGTIANYDDAGYYITDYIDIEGVKRVKVNGAASFENAQCAFYNSDYSVNSVPLKNPTGTGNTWVKKENVVVEVPADAKYMVLAGTSYSGGVLPSYSYFVSYVVTEIEENIKPRLSVVEDTLDKVESDLSDITDRVYTPFSVTNIADKCIIGAGTISPVTGLDGYYITDYIDVSGYEKVYVDCACTWSNAACAFYNSDYSVNSVPIKNSTSSGNTWVTRLNVELSVPAEAKYMVLAGTSSNSSTMPKARYDSGAKIKGIWAGKKWCCVGDSLTERNSRTTKNYADYISEETGITIANMGVSGSGYKRKSDVNAAFYQRVANIPLDSDVVTIFGSGNDQTFFTNDMGTATDTGTDTIGGCINTTIDNIYAVLPAVRLGIVSPTPWGDYNPANHNNGMARYSELLRQICENRSIPFLDLYHCSNLRPWDSSFLPIAYSHDDGNSVHPDETGHALIAGRFRVFIASLLT